MLKATAQKERKKKREKAFKKPSKQTLDIRDCASVTRPPLTPDCSVPPLFLHTEAGKHLNPDVAASQHARSFWYQPPVVSEEFKKSCTQGEWTRQQVNDQTKTNHVVYQHRPTNKWFNKNNKCEWKSAIICVISFVLAAVPGQK